MQCVGSTPQCDTKAYSRVELALALAVRRRGGLTARHRALSPPPPVCSASNGAVSACCSLVGPPDSGS
jgi:hypothetical protein